MEMNEKSVKILNYLVQQKKFTPYSQLAEIFGMSDRMARKYVDVLDKFLMSKGLYCIERKYGSGIKINVTEKLSADMLKWQNKHTSYQYVYSNVERNEIILATLLLENHPISQREFAKMLNVSDTTMVRQMNQVIQLCRPYGLDIVRKNNVGTYITGSEFERQAALNRYYQKRVNYGNLKAYMRGDLAHIDGSKFINLLFDRLEDRGGRIYNAIELFEKQHKVQFDDAAFVRIFLQIFILVCRIRVGAAESGYQPPAFAETLEEWQKEPAFIHEIERSYQIEISRNDRLYLAAGLYSGEQSNGKFYDTGHYKIVKNIVTRMVDIYEEVSGIQYGAFKKRLTKELMRHIQPIIALAFLNMPERDASYEQDTLVKKECLVYTKMAIGDLEQCIGRKLQEEEIQNIAVYFQAYELMLHQNRKKADKILLVCGAGIGISNLIAIQLRNQFQIETIITTSSRQFWKVPKELYQYVISTIEIDGLPPQDYILISPCYTPEDQRKIAMALGKLPDRSFRYDQLIATSSRLLQRLESHLQIQDKQYLQMELIRELLNSRAGGAAAGENGKRVQLDLWDMISEETVLTGFCAVNWEEAVRKGAMLLEQAGAVKSTYAEDILENVKKMGPYMAIMPQVFFSHAENKDNVYAPAISILTLEKGVHVGRDDCDPIRLVITLAAPDASAHLRAVTQLFCLLREKENVDRIINAKNKSAILKIITNMKWKEPYNG